MLEYAMGILFLVSVPCLPFSLDLYVKRGEARYLYLLSYGWLAYSLSSAFYLLAHIYDARLVALFSVAQVLGVVLLLAGALSYFVPIPAKRVAAWSSLAAVGLGVMYWAWPSSMQITIFANNIGMFGAAAYGVARPARFKQIGGSSYYWLIALLVVGFAAAVNWLGYTDVDPTAHIVTPWAGTTAATVMAAFFFVHLENSSTLISLRRREVELARYRDELEELVDRRTAQLTTTVTKLRDANQELTVATRAKDDFLAAMSHELRTPLNSILGFSGVMLQGLAGPLSEEQGRQIAMINTSGKHLLGLVEQVLDLTRVERGDVAFEITQVEAGNLAETAVGIMRPLAESKSLELALSVDRSAGRLNTDVMRVQQVLLNLVGNAIKYTEQGGVALAVSGTTDSVCFEVTDTGIGIAPDDLGHIFDDFFQAEPESGGKLQGAGLGLALSRRLAESLGGSIAASSDSNIGSVFVLRVPRVAATPLADTTARGAT